MSLFPQPILDIAHALLEHSDFLIVPHVTPDGDALGTLLSFGTVLNRLGKKTTLYCPDKIPASLEFLPLDRFVKELPDRKFDAILLLECVSNNRICGEISDPRKIADFVINIDHHAGNDIDGDLNYCDPTAAALAEIVFDIFSAMQIPLEQEEAAFLYVSLVTDTGSFRYSSTTEKTLYVASKLIATGIEFHKIAKKIYFNKPMGRLKLAAALMERIHSELNGKLYWSYASDQFFEETGCERKYMQDMVEELNLIEGADFFLFMSDEPQNRIKIRLRSSDSKVNVSQFAARFGGGGHAAAAGCSIERSDVNLRQFIDNFIIYIEESLSV